MEQGSFPLIMIVEDSDVYRELIANILAGKNFFFAKNGAEALSFFTSRKPNMVFLDIQLPDASGQDLLIKMKQEEPDIFVVMFTSDTDKKSVVSAVQNGAKGYVSKPFSKAKIDEYIERFITYHNSKNSAA